MIEFIIWAGCVFFVLTTVVGLLAIGTLVYRILQDYLYYRDLHVARIKAFLMALRKF